MPLHPFLDPQRGRSEERRERLPGGEHERRASPHWRVASGVLACPACDLPLSPAGSSAITDRIDCPYCEHSAPVRDFLTLGAAPEAGRIDVVARLPRAA